ncbi:MAG TPA: AsmA-like C-terminal region-containing protein, partial [Tepidisphaeraceae bacterium]|nr:AsmA-like C-terminal region-containing protein [Tepidisphaeraceae bacterium]
SRRKRWKWMLISAGVLLVLIYFIYAPIVEMIVGRTLHHMIEARLHAVLQYDSLSYHFPLQIHVDNARLVTDETAGSETLLTVGRLDLELARIPIPHRPMLIRSLKVETPVLHVVRSDHGFLRMKDLRRSDAELREHPPERRLSDLFELRKFTIVEGKVMYEDHTVAGAEPLVFRSITVDLGITPQSKAIYAYEFASRQSPDVDLAVAGTIDIDNAIFNFSKLTMSAQAQRIDGESSIPPQLQKIINDLGITGKVDISGKGQLPIRNLSESALAGDLNIRGVRVKLPDQQGDLDNLDAVIHADFHQGKTQVRLEQFTAQSGTARMTAKQAIAQINEGRWKLEKLEGKIGVSSGAATTQPGLIARTKVLSGTADFSVDANGEFGSSPQYSVAIHPQGVSLLPSGFAQPISNFSGNMQISQSSIRFWNFQGDLLSGHATASGTVKLDTPPTYDADFTFQSIDLSQLDETLLWKGKSNPLTGVADINAKLQGTLSSDSQQALDTLKVQGDCDITGMKLWKSRVLTTIGNTLNLPAEALAEGNGAVVYSIADRTATLSRLAIHTKLLGLQANGIIGFDGMCNLDIIAAPLGDWRSQIDSMKIPIFGDVAGQFASGVQKMVNKSSRLLYKFQTSGKIPDVQTKVVPAPALTNAAAKVFGGMLQGVKEDDLLKSLKEGE